MSAVGIEMTINPPIADRENLKWWYRGSFIVLGLAFIGLSLWQSERADQQKQRDQEVHEAERVRSEGDIKYMQGQLDSQNKMLGILVANSDPKQIAQLLSGMTTERSTLRRDTLALCSEIEAWERKYPKAPEAAIPTKQTQKEQEEQMAYFNKISSEYYQKFSARALSLVQQYGAKGFNVAMLERAAENGYMPTNLVIELRAFANRINDDGSLKR
jgi:hypothetical protein